MCHCCNEKSNTQTMKLAAKNLHRFVDDKLELLKSCSDCFANLRDEGVKSFSLSCSKPHIILWAFAPGFGYWPAKCLSTDKESSTANVRYFGDYTYATLPESKCYLYSENRPKSTENISDVLYDLALRVSIGPNLKIKTFQNLNNKHSHTYSSIAAFHSLCFANRPPLTVMLAFNTWHYACHIIR